MKVNYNYEGKQLMVVCEPYERHGSNNVRCTIFEGEVEHGFFSTEGIPTEERVKFKVNLFFEDVKQAEAEYAKLNQ